MSEKNGIDALEIYILKTIKIFLLPLILLAVTAVGSLAEPITVNDVHMFGRMIEYADEFQRAMAVDMLGELNFAETIPYLTEALSDSSAVVRSKAVQALGEKGPQASDALPALRKLKLSETQRPRLSEYMIQEIDRAILRLTSPRKVFSDNIEGGLSNEDHVAKILDEFGSYDEESRKNATKFIEDLGGGAAPFLIKGLLHPNYDAQNLSAWMLGELGPSAVSAAPVLIKLLNSDNIMVRGGAMGALTKLGPGAVPAISKVKAEGGYNDVAVELAQQLLSKLDEH